MLDKIAQQYRPFYVKTQVRFIAAGDINSLYKRSCATRSTRAVRKISSHFEYLENRSRGLAVTWQPLRGDLTVHP